MKGQSELFKQLPLDSGRFNQIRDERLRPEFSYTVLKYLKLKAENELRLRESYRGRATYELVQNADDAGAQVVCFILTPDGLAFVHDGKWFSVGNFLSLADGWSDKDPQQCIGHKGLGFRSVLDLTPSPFLIRLDGDEFFAAKFSWSLNFNHIQETLRRKPELKAEFDDMRSHGRPVCPVMAIPGTIRKEALGPAFPVYNSVQKGHYPAEFTTMFWFPARDLDIPPAVMEELSPTPYTTANQGGARLLRFLEEEMSVLLPFLAHVDEVYVYEGRQQLGLVKRKREADAGEVAVTSETRGAGRSHKSFSMRFSVPIPEAIRRDAETPRALRYVHKVGLTLSVRLQGGQPAPDTEALFHVYFPTEERTGVGFMVHADFYVKPDRTRLMPGEYNDWLLGEVANKAANEFLTELLRLYKPASVFAALAPNGSAYSDRGKVFVDKLQAAVRRRRKPFVPTDLGDLTPDQVALPPVQVCGISPACPRRRWCLNEERPMSDKILQILDSWMDHIRLTEQISDFSRIIIRRLLQARGNEVRQRRRLF